MTVYEKPQKDQLYVSDCDVARGTKNDNSAFVLFDITEVPYKVVATFKDNEIKPLTLSTEDISSCKGIQSSICINRSK